jgi:hypothetical protein
MAIDPTLVYGGEENYHHKGIRIMVLIRDRAPILLDRIEDGRSGVPTKE